MSLCIWDFTGNSNCSDLAFWYVSVPAVGIHHDNWQSIVLKNLSSSGTW